MSQLTIRTTGCDIMREPLSASPNARVGHLPGTGACGAAAGRAVFARLHALPQIRRRLEGKLRAPCRVWLDKQSKAPDVQIAADASLDSD